MASLILHILFGCLKLNNFVDFTERDENIVEDYLCVWSYIIFASDCTYLHKWQGKLIFVTYWSYLYQNINNLHIFYEFQALCRTCRFSYFSVSSFFTFFSKLLESISYKYRTTWKLLIVTKMNLKNVLKVFAPETYWKMLAFNSFDAIWSKDLWMHAAYFSAKSIAYSIGVLTCLSSYSR